MLGAGSNRMNLYTVRKATQGLAAWLLQTTSLTVAQIADRLHFADTTTFARFFKRLKGCTPKEYRYIHDN